MTDGADEDEAEGGGGRRRTPFDPAERDDSDDSPDESVVETDPTEAESAGASGSDAAPTDANGGDAEGPAAEAADAPTPSGPPGSGAGDGPGADAATADFDEVRSRAAAAVEGEDLASVYVGLVHEDGRKEYYFANAVDEAELRRTAAEQLGMLTRVLAEQSASSVPELVELAAEKAEGMDLR